MGKEDAIRRLSAFNEAELNRLINALEIRGGKVTPPILSDEEFIERLKDFDTDDDDIEVYIKELLGIDRAEFIAERDLNYIGSLLIDPPRRLKGE